MGVPTHPHPRPWQIADTEPKPGQQLQYTKDTEMQVFWRICDKVMLHLLTDCGVELSKWYCSSNSQRGSDLKSDAFSLFAWVAAGTERMPCGAPVADILCCTLMEKGLTFGESFRAWGVGVIQCFLVMPTSLLVCFVLDNGFTMLSLTWILVSMDFNFSSTGFLLAADIASPSLVCFSVNAGGALSSWACRLVLVVLTSFSSELPCLRITFAGPGVPWVAGSASGVVCWMFTCGTLMVWRK